MLNEQTFVGRQLTGFTESYWSTPEIALAEVKRAGLEVVSYAAAEGFVAGMRPLIERLAAERPDAYENVVAIAVATCELPQYRDTGDHLHIAVRKRPDHTT